MLAKKSIMRRFRDACCALILSCSFILGKHWSQQAKDRIELSGWLGNHYDPEGAEQECREAIKLEPNNSNAHLCLGVIIVNKDYRAAKEELFKAIELDHDNVDAHVQLGTIFLNHDEKQSAMEHFRLACNVTFKKGDTKFCDFCKSFVGEVPEALCHGK